MDDVYDLKPSLQAWFPLLAAVSIVFVDIGFRVVTNPLGGTFSFGVSERSILLADLIIFFWLVAMMFTTKLLDGLDGLVTGTVAIGALLIFFLSLQDEWFQPGVASMAILFVGVSAGFLFWNWHPAKIFLGQGGSVFTGYLLAILAVLSDGKIATTFLVMGVPMLDVVRVMIRRLQKKRSLFVGDQEHLHFKLMASGLSHRQTVLLLYAISLLFGMTTLFAQQEQRWVALGLLFVLMLLVGIWFSHKESERRS